MATVKLIKAITKISITGFKGKSGTIERKFNNSKKPFKTTLSTTAATMSLLKAYNR